MVPFSIACPAITFYPTAVVDTLTVEVMWLRFGVVTWLSKFKFYYLVWCRVAVCGLLCMRDRLGWLLEEYI